MAKQRGVVKLEGTVGDVTFYKSKNGYIAREASAITGDRIKTDVKFRRTRENMSEFGRAGKSGKLLRDAIRELLQYAKDGKIVTRLVTAMMRVIKADKTNVRGQRNVIDGEAALLEGFECNITSPLSTSFVVRPEISIDRAAGKAVISLPAYVPEEHVVIPAGGTHYKLVSQAAEIDFEAGTSVVNIKKTDFMPWSAVEQPPMTIETTFTANSKHPVFVLLGIQFSQMANGQQYALSNDAFNSLSIVKVDSNV